MCVGLAEGVGDLVIQQTRTGLLLIELPESLEDIRSRPVTFELPFFSVPGFYLGLNMTRVSGLCGGVQVAEQDVWE